MKKITILCGVLFWVCMLAGCKITTKNTTPNTNESTQNTTESQESFQLEITTNEAEILCVKNKNNKDFIILDVRTSVEYSNGHLPNALNSDFFQSSDFNNYLDQLDKGKTYLVYCRTSNRSRQAHAIMKQKGFKRVYLMLGGFSKWNIENRIIER